MSPTASGASLFSSNSVSKKESSAASTKTSDSTTLTASDFLKLFVTQVKNQDFNDPMDNSDMMNQITQLSNMQMMQEMASYSKSGFALSLVGKTVTATRFDNSGNVVPIYLAWDRLKDGVSRRRVTRASGRRGSRAAPRAS